MKRPLLIFHPIVIFILSLVAAISSYFLSIQWYLRITSLVENLINKMHLDKQVYRDPYSLVTILSTSVLVVCMITGLALIFIYYQKTIQLYRLQENFINNFTHELKTPLASIKLYLETFLKYELPREEQIKFVQFMMKDAHRLSNHVHQILQTASLENPSEHHTKELVDLEKLITQFIRQNEHLFKEGSIQVINKLSFPPLYLVNISLFEMLLMNLLTNAFTHNHQTPEVVITLEIKGTNLNLSFKDNGPGLKKEDWNKVFKKFYRVEVEGRPNKGTGLGLYLSQQIVRIHKGKLKVDSPGPFQGSTFTISFPYAKEALRSRVEKYMPHSS